MIADTIVDVALLVIAEKGWEKPADSREAITLLEREKILPSDLSERVKDLVSFRNLLVHRYGKIDENREFKSIVEGKGDISLFVSCILKFLKN